MLNGIQCNLRGSKILISSTIFVFFGPIRKPRWPSWPLIGWYIFDFSSATAEPNSTKLDLRQVLNILYQICVFWADHISMCSIPNWGTQVQDSDPLGLLFVALHVKHSIHRDNFVWNMYVCASFCLLLEVSHISMFCKKQAFLGMLPFWFRLSMYYLFIYFCSRGRPCLLKLVQH